MKRCKVEGCLNLYFCVGLCQRHYQHMRRFGKIKPDPKPEKSEAVLGGQETALRVALEHLQEMYANTASTAMRVERAKKIREIQHELDAMGAKL